MKRPVGPYAAPPSRRRTSPNINLTPLIDILFIVLLFLVLTTTFQSTSAIDVALPSAGTAEVIRQDQRGLIRVGIEASGQLLLDDRVVTLPELEGELASISRREELNLLIAADAAAAHGDVVGVLDAARRNGIHSLRLETTLSPSAPSGQTSDPR